MPKPVVLNFTKDDLWLSARAGAARQAANLWNDVPDRNGAPKGWQAWGWHIEGVKAEIGVARYLGLPWTGGVGDTSRADVGDYIQVRSSEAGPSLLLHEWDRDEQPFVLVLGSGLTQRAVGWILARDGKASSFWREPHPGRGCYMVPPNVLSDMEDLRRNCAT